MPKRKKGHLSAALPRFHSPVRASDQTDVRTRESHFLTGSSTDSRKGDPMIPPEETGFIFRQCITLKNGKRICMPPGRAFRIPISDDRGSKKED
jgi:hypothetical protein